MANGLIQYWNGRGLMEVPRMLLAIAGKFPGDYLDGRYESPTGDLTHNLGRMPILELGDDQTIGQSVAINYYLATELGLMGKNLLETTRIIGVQEHLKETVTAFRTLAPWDVEPTAEALNKWFDGGALDVDGPADMSKYSERFLTWFMGRIEKTLDDKGFAVGDSLSLADVLIYNVFGENLSEEQGPELPACKRETFGSKARTDAALAKHPKLQAIVQAVANNGNVKKYLAARGVQTF
eukprot:scaffold6314_cov273-Ochromonas_danica.AAC.12